MEVAVVGSPCHPKAILSRLACFARGRGADESFRDPPVALLALLTAWLLGLAWGSSWVRGGWRRQREGKGRVLRWVLAACGKWRGGQRAVFMGGRLAGREKVETGRTVRRGLKREGEERWETRRTRRKRE